jgi:hypothetical protein
MEANVSGTFEIDCSRASCRKIVEAGREQGAYAFEVDKQSRQDPDVIMNVSGITQTEVSALIKNVIERLGGTVRVKIVGDSLLS